MDWGLVDCGGRWRCARDRDRLVHHGVLAGEESGLQTMISAARARKISVGVVTALAALVVSCASGGVPTPVSSPPAPTTTPIPLPTAQSLVEEQRNRVVNEAVSAATRGCPGTEVRLSGPPTRVSAALTSLITADGLVNPEADFSDYPIGPGGTGAPTVWVFALEGQSVPLSGEARPGSADIRSFVFVIHAGVPKITGCVVRDAPMPTYYPGHRIYGGFEFEVLIEGR